MKAKEVIQTIDKLDDQGVATYEGSYGCKIS